MTEVFALAGKIVGSVGGRVFLLGLVAGRKTDCRMGLGFVEGGVARARFASVGCWVVGAWARVVEVGGLCEGGPRFAGPEVLSCCELGRGMWWVRVGQVMAGVVFLVGLV